MSFSSNEWFFYKTIFSFFYAHSEEMILGNIEEKDVYLVPVGGAANANRTILTEEVELDIIYTEF